MEITPLNFFALDFEYDYDTETNENILVISFTPRKNRFNHFHIEIKKKDVLKIKEFVDDWLENTKKNATNT